MCLRSQISLSVLLLLVFPVARAQTAGPLSSATVEWTVNLGQPVTGSPVPIGSPDSAEGLLATLGSGKLVVIDKRGAEAASMNLDLPAACPAIAADLTGSGERRILAADMWGSIYSFDLTGKRQWKFNRQDRTGGGFNYLVLADLDGDKKLEVILTGMRGNLYAVDHLGRLRLNVHVTRFRVSTPAVGDMNGDGRAEMIFGSDDSEVYAVDGRGNLLWTRRIEGARFGRALPVIADANKDGRYEAYFTTPFVGNRDGLFALDAGNGRLLWHAPSQLQTYASILVADLNGDGRNQILFGDKNTRLYSVDPGGKKLWERQLDGRGIYFAAAVADLEGTGRGLVFQVVRGAGVNGKALYAVDGRGEVADAIPVEGGGTNSPAMVRFKGESEVRLLVAGGAGKLTCSKLPQKTGAARILWPVKSASTRAVQPARAIASSSAPIERRFALKGKNTIDLGEAPAGAYGSVRVVGPDQTTYVHIVPAGITDVITFDARAVGDYRVEARWLDPATNKPLREQRFLYTLDAAQTGDQRSLSEFLARLRQLEPQLGSYRELTDYAKAIGQAFRGERDYLSELLGYLAKAQPKSRIVLRQIGNPWSNFNASNFFPAAEGISVKMLGNEYESVAVAVTNLETTAVTVRFDCGPFQSEAKTTLPAKYVVEFRDVPLVRLESTGEPSEDVLPLLGEGDTFRLGPAETRKIWLVFHSKQLAAGRHIATLKVGDLLSVDPPLEVPISVDVRPLRLPDSRVYRHGNWLYLAGIADPELREATVKDALEHGTNVFNIPGVSVEADANGVLGKAQTEVHDSLVNRLRGKAFFMVGGSVSVVWPKGFQPPAALEEKTYAEAIRWYAAHMRKLGVDYAEWAFYTMDEPGLMGKDAAYERYVEAVKRIKAADPKVQIYANPAGGARAEMLEPIADLISVWQPDIHLVREEPEALGRIFKRGQYWHYEAPGDQRYLDPLGYYRMKPWVAYQMGMTGGGYWVYSSSSYWFFDRSLATEYGTVYPTQKGPVTTKRWEASRDGAEDFELLWMVREAAKSATPALATEAGALLDEAVGFVTKGQEKVSDISRQLRPYTPEFTKWMDYRERLINLGIRMTATKRE